MPSTKGATLTFRIDPNVKEALRESSWAKGMTEGLDLDLYRNERGFEQIAEVLGVAYPSCDSAVV